MNNTEKLKACIEIINNKHSDKQSKQLAKLIIEETKKDIENLPTFKKVLNSAEKNPNDPISLSIIPKAKKKIKYLEEIKHLNIL